jgi:phospholipid-translocating ATPase
MASHQEEAPGDSSSRRNSLPPQRLHATPELISGGEDDDRTRHAGLSSREVNIDSSDGHQQVRFSFDSARDATASSFGEAPSLRVNIPGPELYTIISRGDMELRYGQGNASSSQQFASAAGSNDSSPVDKNAIETVMSAATTSVVKAPVYRPEPKKSRKVASTYDKTTRRIAAAYQKYILEGLLRQRPLPPSADGRHIPLNSARVRSQHLLDERRGTPYISNFIRSSRYTIWDFLPKQLIFQFSKLANFYFLIMGTMQMIPGLSTTGTFTTIAPLCVFVAFSMGKEGWDDYRRYTLDKVENRSEVWVLGGVGRVRKHKKAKKGDAKKGQEDVGGERGMIELESRSPQAPSGPWAKVQWQDVRVGDIVRLRRDDNVPADMVLLHATGPNGIAYIETMALDGETNLKSKQACPLLAERCSTIEDIQACEAEIVSEDPNLDLYNYEGRVTVKEETMPLSLNNIVYRGSTLRNTTEAIGVVVNSGEECKIRMNANKNVRAKAPAMQYIVNRIVIFLVFFVVALSIGLTGGYYIWRNDMERFAYYLIDATVSFKEIFIAFVIMFNTLIPLSLYISLEIIKLGQLFLLQDIEMYDPVTDTPMVANTSTILENLGQISYVFSDKTGTLTENMMRFRKMSVAGASWLHDMDIKKDAEERERKIRERRKRKDKPKQVRPAPRKPSRQDSTVSEQGDEPLVDKRPSVRDSSGNGSVSRWKSMVRSGHPELKTEQLLEYIRHKPNTTFSRKARHFLLCIALCHTCLPETKENGEIEFQAASPDELALVEAARDLGFLLIDRPAQSIQLQYQDANGSAVTESYQVLDVIEFSSKRKRMSIIIRMPDGKICVFCKGADSAIMPRLKLSHLALQKATTIGRRASKRKSVEKEKAIRRLSANVTPRNSLNMGHPSSSTVSKRHSFARRGSRLSSDIRRKSSAGLADEIESWITRRETEDMVPLDGGENTHQQGLVLPPVDIYDGMVDESLAANEGAVFEHCFQHIDDFATDGLRTLLYAYRYIEEIDYKEWKKTYHDATTSLVDRQGRIEAAGDLIEQKFDLAGATAIEDKLQEGVPDTIDKLRRANIKVWMLTGDKRETAINIGHSARLCKPFSEIYILDETLGDLQGKIATALAEVGRGMTPHSVLVIDGHTLAVVEDDPDLSLLFHDLAIRVDSVICCRASPSQKANLVKAIRLTVPSSMTLAIGDGANDIGMIQASHVGVGISGREGLQAARIADYSIAQFRFLQRLLFVHGRWNYIRTGKYILATFWKEIVFFLVQAHYQRLNGYTGTSLFENWSLTVFNSFFTSLPVILLGIFEKDLQAETLLAVPELYTFGQRNMGFNVVQYLGWTIMGVAESFIIFYFIWGVYSEQLFTVDSTLYAIGSLCFTVSVLFINIKLL